MFLGPYYYYFCRTPDRTAVGTIFNLFNYNSVLGRDSNPSPTRQRVDALRVTPQSQGKMISKGRAFLDTARINLMGSAHLVSLSWSNLLRERVELLR